MKIWMPYVRGGSGTDTFTTALAGQIESLGHSVVTRQFPHAFQYAPDLLRLIRPPVGTEVTLTNTWNGFTFHRRGIAMVTMEQLCVFDPAYIDLKSWNQDVFHRVMVRSFETRTFRAADRVVAVSESTALAVADAFPGVAPVVIQNGVDTDFFVPPERRDPDPLGRFRLLYVGNLTLRKGVDLLPALMEELGDRFVLRYTSGLRTKSRLNIRNSEPLGKLDRVGVRKAYQTSDALVFPTRLEGLPLSVLEAMACGLPVVASDRSSMAEVVDDGVTGLLSPMNAMKMAQSVRTLAKGTFREEASRAAREKVVAEFALARTARRYLELFEEVTRPAA